MRVPIFRAKDKDSEQMIEEMPGKIVLENWELQSVLNGKRRGAIVTIAGYYCQSN